MNIVIAVIFASTLSLASTQDSNIERRFACWGSVGPPVVSAQCQRNTVIHVVRAGLKVQNNAGTQCEFSEADCGCSNDQPGCQMPDVEDLCMGKPSCRLDVTQQYIDNGVCQGFSDYMFIEYKCVQATKEISQDICMTMTQEQASGFLQTPNYPNTYPNNRHCECTLEVTSDKTIDLKILDLRLADESCLHDEVTLEYNGQLTKLCGQSNGLQEVIPTKAHQVKVLFDSDQEGGDNGFWIKYEANGPVTVSCKSSYKPREEINFEDQVVIPDIPVLFEASDDSVPPQQVLPVTYNNEEIERQSPESLEINNSAVNLHLHQEEPVFDENNNLYLTEQTQSEEDFNQFIEMSTLGTLLARTVSFNLNQEEIENNEPEIEAINFNVLTKENSIIDEITIVPVNEELSEPMVKDSDINDMIITNPKETSSEDKIIQNTEDQVVENRFDENNRILDMKREFNKVLQEETKEDKPIVTVVNPRDRIQRQRLQQQNRDSNLNNINSGAREQQNQVPRRNSMVNQRQAHPRQLNRENQQNSNTQRVIPRQSNRNNNQRGIPYDRVSFERDMFEEYSRQRNTPSQRIRNRQRVREEVTQNNQFNNKQVERIRSRQRTQVQTTQKSNNNNNNNNNNKQYEQPTERFNSHNPSIRNNQLSNRNNHVSRIRQENKRRRPISITREQAREMAPNSDNESPWWWKYTATTDENLLPTKFPRNNGLNEKMKNNLKDEQKMNKYHKMKDFIKTKDDINNKNSVNQVLDDGIQVPPNNADNLMGNGQSGSVQTGLLEGSKVSEEESDDKPEEVTNSTTVTVIAVAVIAMIILIVVVGIVVRWVLNKREQKRVMRHRHKKECAMRQQHLKQSNSQPRNLR